MRRDKYSAGHLALYVLGGILAVLLGIRIAPHLHDGIGGLLRGLQDIREQPFAFSWGEGSFRTTGLFLLLYAAGLGAALSVDKNYRRREEHGSAIWESPARIRKKYADPEERNNKILTQHMALGLDTRRHGRNLNVLVCGGSGSGKTRFYAKPNLMNAACSFVVLDPKGIARSTIKMR